MSLYQLEQEQPKVYFKRDRISVRDGFDAASQAFRDTLRKLEYARVDRRGPGGLERVISRNDRDRGSFAR